MLTGGDRVLEEGHLFAESENAIPGRIRVWQNQLAQRREDIVFNDPLAYSVAKTGTQEIEIVIDRRNRALLTGRLGGQFN